MKIWLKDPPFKCKDAALKVSVSSLSLIRGVNHLFLLLQKKVLLDVMKALETLTRAKQDEDLFKDLDIKEAVHLNKYICAAFAKIGDVNPCEQTNAAVTSATLVKQ